MAKTKEHKDVEKVYDDENKAKKRWQTADILDKYRDKSRRPKPKAKSKKKKKGILSGYKALDKYMAEKWKQRDLKKKVKKLKAKKD